MTELEQKALLIAEMDLGQKAKAFMDSDVGIYIEGRAKLYEMELLDKFRNVSARDEELILKLQALSEVPRLVMKWLAEAINNGESAAFQLRQGEEE